MEFYAIKILTNKITKHTSHETTVFCYMGKKMWLSQKN